MTTTWKTMLAATLLAAFSVPCVIAGDCATDLNADGRPDLIVATNDGDASAWVNRSPRL